MTHLPTPRSGLAVSSDETRNEVNPILRTHEESAVRRRVGLDHGDGGLVV